MCACARATRVHRLQEDDGYPASKSFSALLPWHTLALNLELGWWSGSPSDPHVATPSTVLDLQMHTTMPFLNGY